MRLEEGQGLSYLKVSIVRDFEEYGRKLAMGFARANPTEKLHSEFFSVVDHKSFLNKCTGDPCLRVFLPGNIF